ncbi:hypothetical protein BH11BAC3_BH11BAC3_01490 [soil metagenome]
MTKRIFPVIMLLLTCAFANAQQQLFTTGWQFHKGDILNGENNKSDTISWSAVNLPHDWSIEGPFSADWASM